MKVINRKLYGSARFGILFYITLDENDDELIKSAGLVINYKMLVMFAWCKTFWYDKDRNNRIRLGYKNKEIIISKLAIKFK